MTDLTFRQNTRTAGLLDVLAKHRVQTIARGYVNCHPQRVLKKKLDAN